MQTQKQAINTVLLYILIIIKLVYDIFITKQGIVKYSVVLYNEV